MIIDYSHMLKCFLVLLFVGCFWAQGDKSNIDFFKDTEAFDLAKAVVHEDVDKISELITENKSLLEVTNPIDGSNVLGLSIHSESLRSFSKLIDLGSDPNFVNPITSHSILMDAIKPFGSEFEWRDENIYANTLLGNGADPNYVIKEDFTNEMGHRINANSALFKASTLNLEMVKSLISFGANAEVKIGRQNRTPLGNALKGGKFDIAEYYIDSIGVDFTKPLYIGKRDTLYIQDFIVNKFTKAKLKNNQTEIAKLLKENEGLVEANQERWRFIQKLEAMGIDFKNYSYK